MVTRKSLVTPAVIGAALGAVFWVLDSELRSFVYPAASFYEELFNPAPDVFALRILAFILIIVSAIMASALMQLFQERTETVTLHDRLRALYHHTPDPIFGLDDQLRIAFSNEAAAQLLGTDPVSVVGRRCYEVVKGLDAPCKGCGALSVFVTGDTVSREIEETLATGETRWVHQAWRPFRDANGHVDLVIEVVRDISRLKGYEHEVAERLRAEQELLAERDRTQQYLDATTSIMVAIDEDGLVSMINRRGCEVLELPCDQIVGMPWADVFLAEEDRHMAEEYAQRVLSLDRDGRFEGRLVTVSGRERIIAWGISSLETGDCAPDCGVLCSGVDVTEQRVAEEELEFKSFLLDKAADQIVVHTKSGELCYANEVFYTLRGLPKEEAESLGPWGWIPDESRPVITRVMDTMVREGSVVFEGGVRRPDGRYMPMEIHAHLMDVHGEQVVVSSGRDISERKQAEATIQKMAFYDELTGLANRALFLDRLRVALANSTRSGHPVAVMFLDLDFFKHINDTLGHSVGDALLQSVASRLAVNVREGDTLARLGGDEFTLVIPECAQVEDAESIAAKVLSAFEEPFDVGNGRELRVTASVGLTIGTGDTLNVEEALAQADAAMYSAKEEGRHTYRCYCEQIGSAANERFSLREQLRTAISNKELELVYQPQLDTSTGEIIRLEALIRWRHPERGLLAPSQFFTVAEEAGLMPSIGAWTVSEVQRHMLRWEVEGLECPGIAINMSPRELLDPSLIPMLSAALEHPGLDARHLEIEITETTALSDPDRMRTVLANLRAMGIRIAIDDFGTGFSSLDHLRRLPIDAIKVDRTFVQEIGTNPEAAVIARTVIALAHSLNLTVIAEGVETPVQRDFLSEHGCDAMQGFLFSEPVSADSIAGLLLQGIDLAS